MWRICILLKFIKKAKVNNFEIWNISKLKLKWEVALKFIKVKKICSRCYGETKFEIIVLTFKILKFALWLFNWV